MRKFTTESCLTQGLTLGSQRLTDLDTQSLDIHVIRKSTLHEGYFFLSAALRIMNGRMRRKRCKCASLPLHYV
jgi:hypothetical protein